MLHFTQKSIIGVDNVIDIHINVDYLRPRESRAKSLNVRASQTTLDNVAWLSKQLNFSQADIVEYAIKQLKLAYEDKLRRH